MTFNRGGFVESICVSHAAMLHDVTHCTPRRYGHKNFHTFQRVFCLQPYNVRTSNICLSTCSCAMCRCTMFMCLSPTASRQGIPTHKNSSSPPIADCPHGPCMLHVGCIKVPSHWQGTSWHLGVLYTGSTFLYFVLCTLYFMKSALKTRTRTCPCYILPSHKPQKPR